MHDLFLGTLAAKMSHRPPHSQVKPIKLWSTPLTHDLAFLGTLAAKRSLHVKDHGEHKQSQHNIIMVQTWHRRGGDSDLGKGRPSGAWASMHCTDPNSVWLLNLNDGCSPKCVLTKRQFSLCED